jgi:hypothetical protein
MTSDGHKRFLLPKQEQEFETKRELVGLFKQGPLETDQQFAQRIMKAFQDYDAKKVDKRKRNRKGEPPA